MYVKVKQNVQDIQKEKRKKLIYMALVTCISFTSILRFLETHDVAKHTIIKDKVMGMKT